MHVPRDKPKGQQWFIWALIALGALGTLAGAIWMCWQVWDVRPTPPRSRQLRPVDRPQPALEVDAAADRLVAAGGQA